jgi:hypothetical protein
MSYEFVFQHRSQTLLLVVLLAGVLPLSGQELPATDSLTATDIILDILLLKDTLPVINPDTLPSLATDTSGAKPDKLPRKPIFRWEDKPDPKKALIFSFVLPGTGQIYNRKWWKAPIVYVGIGAIAYAIDFQTTEYLQLRLAYKRHQKGLPHQFTGTSIDNANTLRNFRDSADKNRQLAYFGMGGFFLLSGIEAFVDAHLYTFDISDDLSMRLKPSLQSSPGGAALGFGLQVQLH